MTAGMKNGSGHAPRLTRGRIATWQREGAQMPHAFKLGAVHPQHFATPRDPVATQPDTIERQSERRGIHPMLGQNRGNVRMVMLYRNTRHIQSVSQLLRDLAAEKIRMQVVCNRLDRPARLVLQGLYGRQQGGAIVRAGQITMHLRPPDGIAIEQTGGIFKPGSAGQNACRCAQR